MYKYVSVGERKFKVVRTCREEFTSEEVKECIKHNNPLIDVVLSDGRGNLLFCHETRDVQFRDLVPEDQPSE
jgi:hypothetical protein